MGGCSSEPSSFGFDPELVAETARKNRLLTMEIEFSLRCNFNCPYCYVPSEAQLRGEMSPEEHKRVLLQARDLGAGRIIILGGEPTIYLHLTEMIAFIRDAGMGVELFTNGSGVTQDLARFLAEHRVRVVLKMNSFDARRQDRLSGREGAHELIHQALDHLKGAGYPSADHFLAISTVICRQNLQELPGMWTWLKDQGIHPYFETITPQANAKQNPWLAVSPGEVRALFEEIATIDAARYGQSWSIQPPLLGNRCLRHQFSCLVGARGDVMPCVGVNLPIGNVREQPLADIIANSRVLHDLKHHRDTIKGPCRTCEKAAHCYGCRGAAYQLTGDYLASDPLCWHCADTDESSSQG
ncbi:MAG: radical SAM protein [Desulfosarcinaceae bacterium]|nr:radical SAM protein [Desulfosarcinaceae bacterium]